MSECPDYYKTIYKNEFHEFYAEYCGREARSLSDGQKHALQSACEYIFRAGVKTPDPCEDHGKALNLINRIYRLGNSGLSTSEEERIVERVIGIVMVCRLQTDLSHARAKEIVKSVMDPIVTAWGKIDHA